MLSPSRSRLHDGERPGQIPGGTARNSQWHRLARVLLLAYLPVLVVELIANLQTSIPIAYLVRDPASLLDAPFYIGILSDAGILLWAATATVCLFTWSLLRESPDGEWPLFLLAAGVLSTILMMDDLLEIQSSIVTVYFGLPPRVSYVAYFLAVGFVLIRFRAIIMEGEFLLLAIPLALFALSSFLDWHVFMNFIQAATGDMDAAEGIEEGAKLLGILGWFVYFARASASGLKGADLRHDATVADPKSEASG